MPAPGRRSRSTSPRGLKLETDVGSGKGGNSVGLTYEYEY